MPGDVLSSRISENPYVGAERTYDKLRMKYGDIVEMPNSNNNNNDNMMLKLKLSVS